MPDIAQDKPPAQPGVRPRAWWQWVVGLGLLGMAAATMLARYLPSSEMGIPPGTEPLEVRVAPELKPAETVPSRPGEYAGYNVLLVTFDTTRADRVGCYGNTRIQTPNLDRLAHDGVLFSDATAPAPVTLPSHASILTGLHPYRHGARANGLFRLSEEHQLLGEILAAQGYATAAFVSAFVLDARFGLNQGFAHYDDEMAGAERTESFLSPERSASQTAERAVAWLKEQGDHPFFAWVHFFDPHAPHKPPSPYAEQYQDRPYEGEIAFLDAQLGELLAAVEAIKQSDRTLVIVTSDHGEGLSQHDEWTHGCLLYDSTMRVPLVMACGRKLGGGVHVSRPVSLVDILPTALALLGVDSPKGLDGIDLTRPADARRAVYLETVEGWFEYGFAPLMAVRQGPMKYIHGPDPELYDVAADPFESQNLIKSDSAAAEGLKRQLSDFFGGDLAKAAMTPPTHQMSPEEAAKIGALGYVAQPGEVTPPTANLPDPKSMMRLKREVEAAVFADSKVDLDRLLPKLEKLALEHPDVYMMHWYLAQALTDKGDSARAENTLKRCLELRPNLPPALMAMARINVNQRDYDEALTYYGMLLKVTPDHLGSLLDYATLLREQGRMDEAAEAIQRAFHIRPDDEEIVGQMVVGLQTAARAPEAIQLLDEAVRARPTLSVARNALAEIMVQEQRFADAITLLREGLKSTPDDPKLVNNLAALLVTSPDKSHHSPAEAALMMERVCQATRYNEPAYLFTLSVVYGSINRLDEAIGLGEKAHALAVKADRTKLAESITRRLESFRQAKAQGVSPLGRMRPEALMQHGQESKPKDEPPHEPQDR